MLQNRASSLQIQTFSIRFPFDSTFNEVIEKVRSGRMRRFRCIVEYLQAVNIRKWLKRLHRTNGDMSPDFLRQIPQHSISEEVWTDLSIKIEVTTRRSASTFLLHVRLLQDFELTIVDDLFEVKLFQNYCVKTIEAVSQMFF